MSSKRTATTHPNIKLLPNGTYVYRGRGEELHLGTSDFSEALQFVKIKDLQRDVHGIKGSKETFATLFPLYLQERRREVAGTAKTRRKIRQSTYDEAEYIWVKFLSPRFSKMRISSFDEHEWNLYCEKSHVNDLTNHRKVMSSFLTFARAKRWTKFAAKLAIPKHERRKRQIARPEHIKLMFQHATGDLQLFLALCLFMGVRGGEAHQNFWRNANLANRTFYIPKELSKTKTAREIPMNDFVHALLVRRFEAAQAKGRPMIYLFPNYRSHERPMDRGGFRNAWRKLRKDAGIEDVDITFHDLRATYEKFAHMRTDFSETQLEKMAGAKIDTQRNIYVTMTADDLRGLEQVVQFPGLPELLEEKKKEVSKKDEVGKSWGKKKSEKV